MIVLKSKHEKMIRDLEIKIEHLERISDSRLKQIFSVEDSLKTEISINEKLRKDLSECENKLKDLEEKFKKAKKSIDSLGRVYNAMNNKLWCNEESKRQLRRLSDEILECDKINKTYLAQYLKEISMRVGGGEDVEYAGIKEDLETESVG